MRYIGFDMGDGESAVAAFEHGSGIEPVIWPVNGAKSLISAVGMRNGEIVIGESAYTDVLADQLSVRFKSRFTSDPASNEDIVRFVRGILQDLQQSGQFSYDDQFVVGCPAGWNPACRARYRDLLSRTGIVLPQVISESRAAFLYAKYAHTVALDVDVLNESALVIDIGSSTLDYAYIVEGRETGVGTFGENSLGGGILDAALLRRCVERNRQRKEIERVFQESRSWYSYCEIEARRVKEAYFMQLESDPSPSVKKQIHICYDGAQKLTLEMDNDELSHLIHDPLPELDGNSFVSALRYSLENARRLTAERAPVLVLLTGGASRMPFFREMCRDIFDSAVVISCPEPEFSVAKGLAYAGWVDENLRAFRQTIRDEITETQLALLANEYLPSLLPAVADLLVSLMIDEAAIPVVQQWKHGGIATLGEMKSRIASRMQRVLDSPMAQETLAPVVQRWLMQLTERLQAIVDPICDEYDVPRKEMQLDLISCANAQVHIGSGTWSGLSAAGTLLGTIVSVIGGILCGGSGIALVASGPLGFVAGLAVGAVASLLGWGPLSKMILKVDLPLLMRNLPIEKRLRSSQTHRDLKKRLLAAMSPEDSPFRKQLVDEFAKAFKKYVQAVAQAAEIPIT